MRLCPKLPSLMKGRGTKELEQLKSLSLKILEAMPKRAAITEKKRKQYVRQIIYINQGNLPTKLPLLLTLQMNQSFNVRFQL